MKHLQALLRKASKTIRCMWTFTSPVCTRLHADTPRSHAHTWYTGSSLTLIPRWWPWAVSVGRSFQPSRHEIMMRCIRCPSLWLSWRLHLAYPTTVLTPKTLWRTGLRIWLDSGWHPTRSTRQRYWGRRTNTWSYLLVDCMAKQARNPSHRVGWQR